MALTEEGLALASCIRKEQPLAFVGAGTSARLKYPTWTALIDGMAKAVHKKWGAGTTSLARHDDLLWRADEYRTLLDVGDYEAFLRTTFPKCKSSRDAAVTDLVRLPFRHVLTTNYDDVLEQTHFETFGQPAHPLDWSDEGALRDFIWQVGDRVANQASDRRYLHIHGSIEDPKSIVLTDRDYTERYLGSDATARKLFAIFATQRLVFVGFGLSDPDFMEILRIVKHTMGPGEARHFAIVPVAPTDDVLFIRRRLEKKFGITPVFYEESVDHAGLAKVLREVRLQVEERADGALEAGDGRVDVLSAGSASAPASVAPSPSLLEEDAKRRATGRVTTHADDPQKGKWGGKPERNGRLLSAQVVPLNEDSDDWFRIQLDVRQTDPATPALAGEVRFHLHDSFDEDDVRVKVKGGVASLQLVAFGAFTVGVEADGGKTELELDLAELAGAPKAFRSR